MDASSPQHADSILNNTCHVCGAVLPESSTSSIPDELEAEIDTGLKERLDVCNKFAARQLQVGLPCKAHVHVTGCWGDCTFEAGCVHCTAYCPACCLCIMQVLGQERRCRKACEHSIPVIAHLVYPCVCRPSRQIMNSSDQQRGCTLQDYLRTLKARLSTQSESQAALARQQSDRAMQAKQTEVEGLRETLAQDQATLQRYTVALAK